MECDISTGKSIYGPRKGYAGRSEGTHRKISALEMNLAPNMDGKLRLLRQPIDNDFQTERLPICGFGNTNQAVTVSEGLSSSCFPRITVQTRV